MNIPEKVKRKLKEIPDQPGCYMMRDRRGRIIYIGKAASLRKRVQSYFRDASLRSGTPKLRSLVNSVHDLEWVTARNEAEAVLTEGQLIKDYKPRFNVSFRDDKRFLMVRADAGPPLPRFRLCRLERDDGSVYFGPFASSAVARAALEFVEKHFGIRKCPPRRPDAETYRHCINDIVRFCSAPCVGRVTEAAYRLRFEDACAFLRGERPDVLKALRAAMLEAAAAHKYEQAATLRDTLHALHLAVKQRARAGATPAMQREEARAGIGELRQVLGLKHAPGIIEAYDISNISGTYAVASMVCAVDGLPRPNRYRRFRIRGVTGSDDPAMLAEVIERRFRALQEQGDPPPGLVVVDGGIAQLKAARAALAKLDLQDVPVVGLAKRFEELYWKVRSAPLRLAERSAALKVLKRLRDEAHRFALTYHRTLRRRRIRESVLDDVPGIGEKRKQRLLQHFGSVKQLRRAGVDDLVAVPGIGKVMAADIVSVLCKS